MIEKSYRKYWRLPEIWHIVIKESNLKNEKNVKLRGDRSVSWYSLQIRFLHAARHPWTI